MECVKHDSRSQRSLSTPRPGAVSRRRFLALTGSAGVAVLGLSACGNSSPEANAYLVRLYAEYTAVLDSEQAKAGASPVVKSFLTQQRDLIRKEWTRRCGVDKDGNAPATCTDIAQADAVEVPANFGKEELLASIMKLFPADRESGEVLLGCAGALAAVTRGKTVTSSPITVSEELVEVLQRAHSAHYATGVALAKDDGTNAKFIKELRAKLLDLRDALVDKADATGTLLPDMPAGFVPREGVSTPQGAGDVLPFLAEVLPAVTSQLKATALELQTYEDVTFAAQWFVHLCRYQARLDKLLGKNPLKSPTR